MTTSSAPLGSTREAGTSLVELIVSMAIMTAILGSTVMTMNQALKANESVLLTTSMNSSLRTGMDLIVRDLMQVGAGLPAGHVIATPSGTGAVLLNMPGPRGTAYKNATGDTDMSAVVSGAGLGPIINGVATDTITVLTADNNFADIPLTALTNNSMVVAATIPGIGTAITIDAGPDRILAGQLLVIEKGSFTTLVQVTSVDYATRRVTFALGDSLKLNQPGAPAGNVTALLAAAPPDVLPAAPAAQVIPSSATRIRMISYYLDVVDPLHPRLVRRINNGNPLTFDNTLGTAVALDIENLTFSYDLADGAGNPAGVRFTAADLGGSGACSPDPCSVNQIRKVNIVLTARSKNSYGMLNRVVRNTLNSQVSLRGMAFVDEYAAP